MFGLFIWIVLLGGPFLSVILITYWMVTRRRERLHLLVEHLASLSDRGLPIHAGLEPLGRDIGGSVGRALRHARFRVEEGMPLGDALAESPHAIPPLIQKAVQIGERSGNLASALDELRASYRRLIESTAPGAPILAYPIIVAILANLQMITFMQFIHPKFSQVLIQLDVQGPPTWIAPLIKIGALLLLGCISGVGVLMLTGAGSPHFTRSPFRWFAFLLDPLQLAVPVLRRLVLDRSAHRFALATGLFLKSGATMAEAVIAAAEAEPNYLLRRRYVRLATRLVEGEDLSTAARAERALPDDLQWFFKNGEAGGALPERMSEAAAHYDTKTRFSAQLVSRSFLPLITLANGILVFGIALFIILPMKALLDGIGPW